MFGSKTKLELQLVWKTLVTTTSESLLNRIADASDSSAWNRFVELDTPLIFYWSCRAGFQVQDASDLVQEVLGIVSQSIGRFRHKRPGNFLSWLRTITVNQFRQHWRLRKRMEINDRDSVWGQLPDRSTLESSWGIQYRAELVSRAIASMKGDAIKELQGTD